jgi:release factor glutamine methyltransferase
LVAKPLTVKTALEQGRRSLEPVSETPVLDAQLLLMRARGVTRAWLLAHPEAGLPANGSEGYRKSLARCTAGEALPHVLGWWEFFGRRFHLDHNVLIPRPETEHLVGHALQRLAARADLRRVLDIGTGCGCIIISLALEFSGRDYNASDLSLPALRVGQRNLTEYRLDGAVHLIQADLLTGLRGPFDLITANLPYIPSAVLDELAVAEREPRLALDGGSDGLDPLRRLATGLRRSLRPGGELLLELDPDQMAVAETVLRSAIRLEHVEIQRDLAGKQRVLHVRRDPADGIHR